MVLNVTVTFGTNRIAWPVRNQMTIALFSRFLCLAPYVRCFLIPWLRCKVVNRLFDGYGTIGGGFFGRNKRWQPFSYPYNKDPISSLWHAVFRSIVSMY